MLKKLLTMLVLSASAISVNTARAHGDNEPNHGGVVQAAGGLSFELVAQSDGAALYVENHGRPMATAGMTGRLTVLNGRERSETALTPAGDNKLAAQKVTLAKGANAVASLTTAQKKTITVRFTVK